MYVYMYVQIYVHICTYICIRMGNVRGYAHMVLRVCQCMNMFKCMRLCVRSLYAFVYTYVYAGLNWC